jgi:hypothetical protein
LAGSLYFPRVSDVAVSLRSAELLGLTIRARPARGKAFVGTAVGTAWVRE